MEKQKKTIPFASTGLLLIMLIISNACRKKENEEGTGLQGQAYIRVINLTTNDTRFYFDNIINVNGDTAVYNFKNELYARITTDYKGLPLPVGLPVTFDFNGRPIYIDELGFRIAGPDSTTCVVRNIDLKIQKFVAGVYGWGNVGETYFPNVTHRLDVAPIVGNISYYKWAKVPSGNRKFTFRPSRPKTINFQPSVELLPVSYEADHLLEEGKYYTFLLAPVKLGSNDITTTPSLITVPEVTEQSFNDSSSYIRFINFTEPSVDDQLFNVRSEIVDVYFVKEIIDESDSLRPFKEVGEEVLVQAGLKRFSVEEPKLDYFEVDMGDILKDASRTDSLLKSYQYKFKFYTTGESRKSGQAPLAEIKIRMEYSINKGITTETAGRFQLLARDPENYQTTITTVVFNILNKGIFNEFTTRLIKPVGVVTYNLERTNTTNTYLQ